MKKKLVSAESGAEANQSIEDGETALMRAAQNGFECECVRMLLQGDSRIIELSEGLVYRPGPQRSGLGYRPDPLIKKWFSADANASVDEKDSDNETALMQASWHGHTSYAQMLLEASPRSVFRLGVIVKSQHQFWHDW